MIAYIVICKTNVIFIFLTLFQALLISIIIVTTKIFLLSIMQ